MYIIKKKIAVYLQTILEAPQLGPQKLKYVTFLSDSSDTFVLSHLYFLDKAEKDGVESFLAWEYDPTLFLACCCSDLSVLPHLQIPWSFIASTVQALLVELIFLPDFELETKWTNWKWEVRDFLIFIYFLIFYLFIFCFIRKEGIFGFDGVEVSKRSFSNNERKGMCGKRCGARLKAKPTAVWKGPLVF